MDDPIGSHYEKMRRPSWNVNILRHERARGGRRPASFLDMGMTAATSTTGCNPLWLLDGLVAASLRQSRAASNHRRQQTGLNQDDPEERVHSPNGKGRTPV